jgi:hypothetical protein
MIDPEAQIERDGLNHYPTAFLQNLIDTGEGWQSEGSLSAAVVRALEDGTCVLGPVAHRDYHNNIVPARADVADAAKGSLAYANARRADRGLPRLVEEPDGTVHEEIAPA